MQRPTIQQAKDLAYANRATGALILQFGGGQFASASYGVDRKKCDAMGRVLDRIHALIADGTIRVPAELGG